MSDIKWGQVVQWVVLGSLVAILISLVFMTAYMVVLGFQMRGNPPREVQGAFVVGPIYGLVSVLATALGGFIGGRKTALKAEGSYQLSGLMVGIGVGILVAAFTVFQISKFNFWVPVRFVLGIVGGWLGGLPAAESAEAEMSG